MFEERVGVYFLCFRSLAFLSLDLLWDMESVLNSINYEVVTVLTLPQREIMGQLR
jgi:hypothetical protein